MEEKREEYSQPTAGIIGKNLESKKTPKEIDRNDTIHTRTLYTHDHYTQAYTHTCIHTCTAARARRNGKGPQHTASPSRDDGASRRGVNALPAEPPFKCRLPKHKDRNAKTAQPKQRQGVPRDSDDGWR